MTGIDRCVAAFAERSDATYWTHGGDAWAADSGKALITPGDKPIDHSVRIRQLQDPPPGIL